MKTSTGANAPATGKPSPKGAGLLHRAGRPRRMTKPRKMWAYVATDGALHLYTSQRKARGVWAEQGPTKRIREVYVQWPTTGIECTDTTVNVTNA